MPPHPMAFFDGSPFTLDIVSDRFEVLLRRYQLFLRDIPTKFQQWLSIAPSQKRVFSTLESICTELFPDLMSIASADFPHRWTLPVACVALKHYVSTSHLSHAIEISECGRALRVVDAVPKTKESVLESKDASLLRASLYDSLCAASRTAALEVKVAELECRHKGLLLQSDEGVCKKRRTDEGACKKSKDHPAENVFAYLAECRTEALDALVALRKTSRRERRHAEKLSAANAEIARLRGENEALLKQRRAAEAPPVATVLLPKRVLSMAGYWNLSPNDLLRITPILVDTVQQRGGSVVRRDGMNVCFAFHERALLIEAAIHTMTETLPQYERRLDF
jgi:hypothetical protein